MKPILIRGGRIIDPVQDIDRVGDLVLANGVVKGVGIFFALVMKPIAYPMRFEIGFF